MGRLAVFNIRSPLPLRRTQWPWRVCPCLASPDCARQGGGSSEASPTFHLLPTKKTLFYSFKAEDSSSAQRYPFHLVPHSPSPLSEGASCHPGLWLLFFSGPPVLSGPLGPQQKKQVEVPRRTSDRLWVGGFGPRSAARAAVRRSPSSLGSQRIRKALFIL